MVDRENFEGIHNSKNNAMVLGPSRGDVWDQEDFCPRTSFLWNPRLVRGFWRGKVMLSSKRFFLRQNIWSSCHTQTAMLRTETRMQWQVGLNHLPKPLRLCISQFSWQYLRNIQSGCSEPLLWNPKTEQGRGAHNKFFVKRFVPPFLGLVLESFPIPSRFLLLERILFLFRFPFLTL